MGKLSAFLFISLDGYYKDKQDGIEWHEHTEEGNLFSEESLRHGNTLLFGRKTYELMHSFWPTQMAHQTYPEVARGMNESEKIVISNSLKSSPWKNTRIISKNWIDEINQLKKKTNITLLGSGSILTQLAEAGTIDQLQFLIDPIVLGSGTPVFKGIKRSMNFKLAASKTFKNGSLLVTYSIL